MAQTKTKTSKIRNVGLRLPDSKAEPLLIPVSVMPRYYRLSVHLADQGESRLLSMRLDDDD